MLILGGGSDIAAAFARRCITAGLDTLVLAGRAGGSVDVVATSMLRDHPDVKVEVVGFDGADTARHRAALIAIDEQHGPFDTVVVAFGVLGEPFTVDTDPAKAAELATINFSSAVSSCLASLQILRGEPNARLVVLSSITAVRPRIGNIIYGSAKAGVDAFATELRAPARDIGVDVVIVRPGFVHSRMTEGLDPAPFAATTEQVADDMFNGLTNGRAVIHSPAILSPVGRVLRLLPAPIWRRVSAQ